MSFAFFRKTSKLIFLSINLLIAVFLLLGCYGSKINEGDYWFTGLFALATVYNLFLLIGFVFFWLIFKKSYSLISITCIALCWTPLKEVIRFPTIQAFSYKKVPAELRVMSWNVEHFCITEHHLHPEKKDQMLDLINKVQPDIACFQEMVAGDSSKKAINYLPDFKKKLGMNNYYFAFRNYWDFDVNHHFGDIIFSKYPIINKQIFENHPGEYNSIFQFVDIVKGHDTFRVFNIHLQSLKFSPTNRNYINDPVSGYQEDIKESKNILMKFRKSFIKKHQQADFIKKRINQSPYPVILCGDFNDVPNGYAYTKIGTDMKNAFGEKGGWIGNTYDGISPTLRIDNIFVDRQFEVSQYTRIKRSLSDHFPIVADISLIRQSSK